MSQEYDLGGVDPATQEQPKTKIEARQEQVEKAKAKASALKAEYAKIREFPAVQDLLVKIKSFSAYHQQVAKARVGADAKGNTLKLDPAERLAELDRAAGQDEILDYLERMLA